MDLLRLLAGFFDVPGWKKLALAQLVQAIQERLAPKEARIVQAMGRDGWTVGTDAAGKKRTPRPGHVLGPNLDAWDVSRDALWRLAKSVTGSGRAANILRDGLDDLVYAVVEQTAPGVTDTPQLVRATYAALLQVLLERAWQAQAGATGQTALDLSG